MGDPSPPGDDDSRLAEARPARWIGPVWLAAPLIVEVAAVVALFVPGAAGWFFGLLFLGVPFAYLVAAAMLIAEDMRRHAAIAVALAPVSAVVNGLFLLSMCQSSIANNHGGTLP